MGCCRGFCEEEEEERKRKDSLIELIRLGTGYGNW